MKELDHVKISKTVFKVWKIWMMTWLSTRFGKVLEKISYLSTGYYIL
jgi:hypothetical protein